MRQRQAEQGKVRPRLPAWLRAPLPGGPRYSEIKTRLRDRNLHTVCEEAQCPNIGQCWNEGTATLMLLGDTCTRTCRFCAIKSHPRPAPPDPDEPAKAADQVALMGLDYVVLTSVNRDDLADGGAAQFARTVRAIQDRCPGTLIEVLTPDFQGDLAAVATVLDAAPDVFAHNVETVAPLTSRIRDRRASFDQSCRVLAAAKAHRPQVVTKSSVMLGLGETDAAVWDALRQLRTHAVDAVTIGQYLRPSPWHAEVVRFVEPSEFDAWHAAAMELGFRYCASGPLVRSSYRAGEHYLRGLATSSQ
ncbi:MAG: lipoyl synthase [Deltaproteobacteria bacterium]|nr:lipoyl synthase [Deltaproteobacteria bacterium]